MKQPENIPELKIMARTMIAFIRYLNFKPTVVLKKAHVNYSNYMNGRISLTDETKLNIFKLLNCTRKDFSRFEIEKDNLMKTQMRVIGLCNGLRNTAYINGNVGIGQRKCSEAISNVDGD